MAEIVNLRRARKAKLRGERERAADAARIAHGRTKAEKTLTAARDEQAASRLDGHRRDRGTDETS